MGSQQESEQAWQGRRYWCGTFQIAGASRGGGNPYNRYRRHDRQTFTSLAEFSREDGEGVERAIEVVVRPAIRPMASISDRHC